MEIKTQETKNKQNEKKKHLNQQTREMRLGGRTSSGEECQNLSARETQLAHIIDELLALILAASYSSLIIGMKRKWRGG